VSAHEKPKGFECEKDERSKKVSAHEKPKGFECGEDERNKKVSACENPARNFVFVLIRTCHNQCNLLYSERT